jgi:hypothetical protein
VNLITLRLACETAAVRRLGISKIPVSERDFGELVIGFLHTESSSLRI